MKFLRVRGLIAAAVLLSTMAARAASQESAARSFEGLKTLMLQIKTSAEAQAEKRSYGTGFVVRKDGWIITNFHVVADAVWKPERNKIFAVVDGQSLEAKILSVDIVNDLSLLKIDHAFPKAVTFATQAPHRGETVHSLGLPEDLDWTIVNGVYNGQIEQGPYKLVHLSSPLNHGMSGGPTVNAKGELIGVNVSGHAFSQQISFAVPARYASQLIDRAMKRDGTATPPLEDIEEDVSGLQKQLAQLLLAGFSGKKKLQGWNLPKFPNSVRCWGAEAPDEKASRYDERVESCEVEHFLYIDGRRYFGMFRLQSRLLERKQLNAVAWRRVRNQAWSTIGLDQTSGIDKESAINFGAVKCQRFDLAAPVGARRLRVCSQPILPFRDLHETEILWEVEEGNRALQINLTASGLSQDRLRDVIKELVERPQADRETKPAAGGARAQN